ncbi:M20/M25/M40 family metallo-hydrolase [Cystobacter ferrugineus]|uniref:M20/M25/M40 family metallo-hydrolase n=1 Tax=Cystobacter ferrugineus TaxID=83449 RepID=UPI000AD21732|nr:M20/M25/M40 family metallo-hydrolase [Cystobacter ferrugineus]
MSRFGIRLIFVALLGFMWTCTQTEEEPSETGREQLHRYIDEQLFDDLSTFVAARTYRGVDQTEAETVANLQKIQEEVRLQVEQFNEKQKVHKLVPFEWKKTINGREYWLFGVRVGSGSRRVALSSHLDTVPPGTLEGWEPFKLVKEQRTYFGREQEFYVGRGSIDDKGPALIAFNVLKAVARQYDGDSKLNGVTLEVLFDTSEETDMAMPYYLEDKPEENPDLGVIFDAMWCIRAEKGGERPVFTLKRGSAKPTGVWIESLDTPKGPANQIPESATAVIRSDSPEALKSFAQQVASLYQSHGFDDPAYRRAELSVDTSGLADNRLVLTTKVSGAQHGSAPDENREEGTNPLISLTNFLSAQVGTHLARNEISEMSRFITWSWGTQVFGEHHPDLLRRNDEVFKEGNGTTYAVTRFYTNPEGAPDIAARVEIDIRYALGHHSVAWDGKTEGLVGGKGTQSVFQDTFTKLLGQFPAEAGYTLEFQTRTVFPPDVRLPEGNAFQRVSHAFEQVLGEQCPRWAIGGGTDAKGNTNLIAAGALFTDKMGPPINYHGINEGAPVEDLRKSADILYTLLTDEVENAGKASSTVRPLFTPMHIAPDFH